MNSKGYAICFFYDQVRVYRVDSATTVSPLFHQRVDVTDQSASRQTAKLIADKLLSLGYGGQAVLIGLDAFQVLTAGLPSDRNQSANERRKVKLEIVLEEFLPMDAENMCAVPLPTPANNVWIAIRDRIEPFMESLHDCDINIQRVVPMSALIARTLQDLKLLPGSCQLWVFAHDRHDVIDLLNGTILDWKLIDVEAVTHDGTERPRFRIDIETDEKCDNCESFAQHVACQFETVLARGFRRIQQNRIANDLPEFGVLCPGGRKHPLRSSIEFAGVALIVLLLACSASFYFRGTQHREVAELLDTKTGQMYARAIPEGAKTRLYERSLRAKLKRLTDQSCIVDGTSRASKVADNLKLILQNIPRNFEIELEKIRIAASRIELKGRVTELADLDLLKKRLADQGLSHVTDEHLYGKEFRLVYLVPDALDTSKP